MIEAFFTSTFLVALGEIGDKTQLLPLMLAARFRRPWLIVFGIFLATLFNHAFAGLVGDWFRSYFHPSAVRWVLGVAFVTMGIWVLIPDKLEEPNELKNTSTQKSDFTVFIVTFSTFFIAEMGDKTQLATIGLAARFDYLTVVVLATTLGMMIANIPAVWVGSIAYKKIPLRLIRSITALFFILIGACIIYWGLPQHPPLQEGLPPEHAHLLYLDTLNLISNSIFSAA